MDRFQEAYMSLSSKIGPEPALTVTQSMTGLQVFTANTLPLLIYATIPAKIILPEVVHVREEMLGITASLHMTQSRLPFSVDTRVSSIIAKSLIPCLTGCVLLYSEIEACIEKVRMPLGMPIKERVFGTFKKAKIGHIVPTLKDINSVMHLIADIIEWYFIPYSSVSYLALN